MAAATERRLRLALACALVVALWAAWNASQNSPRSVTWTLAGAVAGGAALVWWALRRSRQDIAELRARNRELHAQLTSFSVAQQRFLRHVAHEIKTPLTIVVNQTELIRRRSTDRAAVESHARGIVDYLLHISGLIDGFLRLGSPSTPADSSGHAIVPVHDLVVDVVQRTQSMARNGGVDVVTSLLLPEDGREAPEILGDRALLEAMSESLLRHAVHRTPRGSRVRLRVEAEGDTTVLVVHDSGTAIAGSDIDSVLGSFFGAPSAEPEGAGPLMGLTIARLIAEHHGGSISFRNHPDGGGEARVRLPRREAGRPPAAADATDLRPRAALHPVGADQRRTGGPAP